MGALLIAALFGLMNTTQDGLTAQWWFGDVIFGGLIKVTASTENRSAL
jgi:hypothetical protein